MCLHAHTHMYIFVSSCSCFYLLFMPIKIHAYHIICNSIHTYFIYKPNILILVICISNLVFFLNKLNVGLGINECWIIHVVWELETIQPREVIGNWTSHFRHCKPWHVMPANYWPLLAMSLASFSYVIDLFQLALTYSSPYGHWPILIMLLTVILGIHGILL